jgi:integrase
VGRARFGQGLVGSSGREDESGRAHTVPLSPAALEVVEAQARARTGDMVFPGRGGGLMSYDTFTSSRAGVGVDAANAHGWRSVFRDWAGEYGDVERDLAEFVLAHMKAFRTACGTLASSSGQRPFSTQ